MLPLIGSIIGAGASLIGGAMQSSATQKANDQNYKAQKEFAQQGLRWKVEDAKKAGVHPVYAVGAPTQSFSPSFVGDTAMGNAMASAGQDIGRAVGATQTAAERTYAASMAALSMERASLENDLLRSQIRRTVLGTGPAFPSAAGQDGEVGVLKTVGGDLVLGPHSPAQLAEQEYGEVVGDVHGISRWLHDVSSAAVEYMDNLERPRRIPGEPYRPPTGMTQLGSNYSRPRVAGGSTY